MEKNKFDKPFVVIDLGSGSYLLDSEGHEKFNEDRNPKTGKFYGYCPPLGNVNIHRLGGKSKDMIVTGVTVVYVRKQEGSTNREVSSYIENATVYGQLQEGYSLGRLVKTAYGNEFAVYSIESDDLIKISDIEGADPFVIECRKYSPSMFRHQRFYRGTYPELDAELISYLNAVEEKRRKA